MRDQYDLAEEQKDREFERLPVCDICHQPITTEHFYDILGDKYRPDCIDSFRVDTDQYIADQEGPW